MVNKVLYNFHFRPGGGLMLLLEKASRIIKACFLATIVMVMFARDQWRDIIFAIRKEGSTSCFSCCG